MKSMKHPTLAILALVLFCLPTAHAETPAPSANASAVAASSVSAEAAPAGMPIASYAWPKETSDQPKDEEWAGATELETISTRARSGWTRTPVKCRQRVLRAWVRLDCLPPDPANDTLEDGQRFYGSLWGLAGDVSSATAQYQLVSSVEKYAKKVTEVAWHDTQVRMMRLMGAVGTVIFQAKYGSATMLRLDEIFWLNSYDGGGSVLVDPGIIIDVSWALGEKHPTIELEGS